MNSLPPIWTSPPGAHGLALVLEEAAGVVNHRDQLGGGPLGPGVIVLHRQQFDVLVALARKGRCQLVCTISPTLVRRVLPS
jgi:hypothetical protein